MDRLFDWIDAKRKALWMWWVCCKGPHKWSEWDEYSLHRHRRCKVCPLQEYECTSTGKVTRYIKD